MEKKPIKNVNKIAIKYLPLYALGIIFLIASQYLYSLISVFIGQAISIFSGESEIILPNFLQQFYDGSSSLAAIKSLCLIFIVTGIIMVILRYIRTVFRRLYFFEVETNVSLAFFSHAIRLPKSFITKHSTGDIIQRNIQDSTKYSKFVGDNLFKLLHSMVSVIVVLFNIFTLSRTNFFISLLVVALIISFQIFYSFVIVRKREEKLSFMWSKMDSVNQQTFTNIMMVKSFAGEEKELKKLSEINLKTNKMQYDVDIIYARYWAIIDIFSVFYNALMTFVIGFLFVKGSIGLGIATSLILYNGDIISSIDEIMDRINAMIKNSIAGKRLNEYLQVNDDFKVDGTLMPTIDGKIEIKDLTVNLDGNDILKNINLSVMPGQTIGIVGKSGSGKSTLFNTLTKLIDDYEGSIKISGVELKNINKQYLRNSVGVVNQDSFVFSTTVKENIKYICENASNDEIRDITKRVCFDEDIRKFNSGYDTMVGERGVTLSGGQKQRISIARTLLKNSKILFLDDCLSALDNNVAKQIKQNIKQSNATCFIISHNLLNVMDADKIIILNEGEIAEEGTHEELLKNNGIYSRLWNLQQQIKEDDENETKN